MILMMLTLISMMLTMTYLADNLKTGACFVILVRQGAPEPVSHSQHRHLHSEAYGQLEWGFRVDMTLVFRLVGSSNSLYDENPGVNVDVNSKSTVGHKHLIVKGECNRVGRLGGGFCPGDRVDTLPE